MAPRTFTPMQYTADNGRTYQHQVADYIRSQMDGSTNPKIGGAQATALDSPLPSSFKPRTALVRDPVSNTTRRVPVMDTAADLWTAPEATIQLYVGNPPVLTTFHKTGTQGERSRHRNKLAVSGG